jgi:DNA-binding PadR family transcriptional regulator
MCILLAGVDDGELTRQRLKTQLEARYDTRLDPESFSKALSALVEAGFVESRTDGITELYSLTDAGKQRLQDQLEWMRENIDGSSPE